MTVKQLIQQLVEYDNQNDFWVGMSAVAFMASMSFVPVLIIINDLWA